NILFIFLVSTTWSTIHVHYLSIVFCIAHFNCFRIKFFIVF
ncbi:hypothetical protein M153_88740001023, partial [Pseudoloma neurophilia]